MPAFKTRQPILPVGGFTSTGAAGNFIFGSACINCPSATGHAVVVSASLAVAGVADGDKLFITPHNSAPSGMVLRSACAIAGGISASWFNTACLATAASGDVPVSYLIFS